MRAATVGFRVHSGWTAFVALAIEKGAPVVLARERVHLVETFTYEFRQPYHTAEKLGAEKGSAFVSRMRNESRRLALRAIRKVAADLRAQGYKLNGCGLLLSSRRPLPKLSQILASHSLIHSADGELFREALLHAAARCGLKAQAVKEREALDSAARALHIKPADLARRVSELGRALGSPWTQDEKLATMAAWLALGSK
jgi:hypothetical protein